MNQTHAFSRRRFLRGAGAIMALPFLDSLAPRTLARTTSGARPPLRTAIISFGQGTVHESWVPQETGPLGKLPSILRSLQPYKDDLTILSGLSHNGRSTGGTNAHQHCAYLHLTGAPEIGRIGGKVQTTVSIDQVAAKHLADATFFPSLEIGASTDGYSYTENGVQVPYERDPKRLFERMFRGGRPIVAPNWQARANFQASQVQKTADRFSHEKSVLDLVREDAKSVERILGRDDREKMANYLDSVRSLEQRLEIAEQRMAMELADLHHPGPSAPVMTEAPSFDDDKYGRGSKGNPLLYEEYLDLMSDLMVLAFQTDTTRMITFSAGGPGSYPGVVTVGYERHGHTLDHNGNGRTPEDAEPIAREACRQKHEWMTNIFAKSVEKMKNIDEGGSSLLDNSMILYTSYMAHGGHSRRDYPCVIVGKGGGRIKPGRHIAYQQDTPVSNLYCEMLNLMGAPVKEFGDNLISPKAAYDGRLPGLA